ncbi:MAG: threo-3-hydroxy-L-aspartate ammonia-lyase [Planctomycetota bacterium]
MTSLTPSPDAPPSPVGFDDIVAAAARCRELVHRTPLVTSRTLDALVGASVVLKCENFQRVGAFKFRGATNAMMRLAESGAAGVLTYSSGNHAQAIALAGRLLEIPTTIVMPSDAPAVKLTATRAYLGRSGEVIVYDRSTTTREELGQQIAEERGLTIIPPYDHPDVIAGQGTAAMELIEDAGPFDLLLVCCGGGGLLSGSAIASTAMQTGCKVVGVEPEAADDAARSFHSRTLHAVHDPITIADGARTPSLGRWTFPLVLANVDDMITVSEQAIARSVRFAFERLKLVVEPSGALGLAGLGTLARQGTLPARVGVIISGGNLDPHRLPSILELAGDDDHVL